MYYEEEEEEFLSQKRRGARQLYYQQVYWDEKNDSFYYESDSGRVILKRVGNYVINLDVYLYFKKGLIVSENIVYHTELYADLDSMPTLWSLLRSKFGAQELGGLTSKRVRKYPWELQQNVSLLYDYHGEMYMDREVTIAGRAFSLYKIGLCATTDQVQKYQTKKCLKELQNPDCGNLEFVFRTGDEEEGRLDGSPPKYFQLFSINFHLYRGSKPSIESMKEIVTQLKFAILDVSFAPHRDLFAYDRSCYWNTKYFRVANGERVVAHMRS